MALTSYPIEIEPPDITPYRYGNTGVDYISTFDSGKYGPHAMISAVVHGNELCGADTLDFLHKNNIRPVRGKLTLAFMNVSAYRRFDPAAPEDSRYVDEDFNRVWAENTLEGSRDSVELRRAREVRTVIDQVDFLLDIHSMQHCTTPLMLCGPTPKGRSLAKELSYPSHVVSDSGHATGTRMRDYGPFAHNASPRNALLIECGQHWDRRSVTVAKEAALRFLRHLKLIDPDFVADNLPSGPLPSPKTIGVTEAVTAETDEFEFVSEFKGMETIERAGTLIGNDGAREIRTPFDDCVLIMPSRHLRKGATAVRFGRFVTDRYI